MTIFEIATKLRKTPISMLFIISILWTKYIPENKVNIAKIQNKQIEFCGTRLGWQGDLEYGNVHPEGRLIDICIEL